MKMNRRLELVELGKPLVETTREIPRAPDNGFIIKISHAGICGTDANLARRGHPKARFPWVLGHEIAGFIHDIGNYAAQARPDLTPGGRIVVYPWTKCGVCADCKGDRSGFCRGSPPFYTPGIATDGGFQEYVTIHNPDDIFAVDDSVDLGVAAIASCSGLTSWNAVTSIKNKVNDTLKVRGKARILLIGAGGLGLWGVEICRYIWPDDKVQICAVDSLESKLDDAKKAGADITMSWDKDGDDAAETEKIKSACGGLMDAVIDYTGVTSSLERTMPLLNTCGVVVLCGMSGGSMPETPQMGLIYGGITVQGVLVGSRKQFKEVLDLISSNKLRGPPTQCVSMEEVNSTLDRVGKGEQKGRAVITF